MTFSKIDLFTSEKWKCTGVKNADFAIFDVFRFLRQNQKKMFDDCDEIWRVYNKYGDTFTVLRGKINYKGEARNMGLNTFSFLWQNQKKMFVDWDDFLGVYNRYGDTFNLLRGRMGFNEEARN